MCLENGESGGEGARSQVTEGLEGQSAPGFHPKCDWEPLEALARGAPIKCTLRRTSGLLCKQQDGRGESGSWKTEAPAQVGGRGPSPVGRGQW